MLSGTELFIFISKNVCIPFLFNGIYWNGIVIYFDLVTLSRLGQWGCFEIGFCILVISLLFFEHFLTFWLSKTSRLICYFLFSLLELAMFCKESCFILEKQVLDPKYGHYVIPLLLRITCSGLSLQTELRFIFEYLCIHLHPLYLLTYFPCPRAQFFSSYPLIPSHW
jgi:hypothetical protein